MGTVRFALPDAQVAAVETIVRRWSDYGIKAGLPRLSAEDRLSLRMDLAAVNATCPLDLDRLAFDFPAFDFCHDVAGIVRHLDRETGELGGCFLPRCALPESGPVGSVQEGGAPCPRALGPCGGLPSCLHPEYAPQTRCAFCGEWLL